MSFLLSCTSLGLQTCPMEGFNQRGLLSSLKVPQPWRYEAGLMVSVGRKYQGHQANDDDVGMKVRVSTFEPIERSCASTYHHPTPHHPQHPDPRGIGANSTPRFTLDEYMINPDALFISYTCIFNYFVVMFVRIVHLCQSLSPPMLTPESARRSSTEVTPWTSLRSSPRTPPMSSFPQFQRRSPLLSSRSLNS